MVDEKNSETLPYGLEVDKLFLLLDEIKKRPSCTDDELSPRVGTSSYPKVKNIAVELNLITTENNKPTLTATGKNIAWEINESEKKKFIHIGIVQKYRPYEIALDRMIKEGKETIQTEFVQQLWAREMNFKLSEDNLARAVSFFFKIIEYAGLGTTYIGRHGQKTRFSFRSDVKEILHNVQSPKESQEQTDSEKQPSSNPNISNTDVESSVGKSVVKSDPTSNQNFPDLPSDSDKNWKTLTTDFFVLKIQNRPEVWDLLTQMIPLYRNTLLSLKKQDAKTSQNADTKMDVTPSE